MNRALVNESIALLDPTQPGRLFRGDPASSCAAGTPDARFVAGGTAPAGRGWITSRREAHTRRLVVRPNRQLADRLDRALTVP
jgi:hypothetical protein